MQRSEELSTETRLSNRIMKLAKRCGCWIGSGIDMPRSIPGCLLDASRLIVEGTGLRDMVDA